MQTLSNEFPLSLSKDEKVRIKQALIQRFSQGQIRSLQQFLADYRLISDYPETR